VYFRLPSHGTFTCWFEAFLAPCPSPFGTDNERCPPRHGYGVLALGFAPRALPAYERPLFMPSVFAVAPRCFAMGPASALFTAESPVWFSPAFFFIIARDRLRALAPPLPDLLVWRCPCRVPAPGAEHEAIAFAISDPFRGHGPPLGQALPMWPIVPTPNIVPMIAPDTGSALGRSPCPRLSSPRLVLIGSLAVPKCLCAGYVPCRLGFRSPVSRFLVPRHPALRADPAGPNPLFTRGPFSPCRKLPTPLAAGDRLHQITKQCPLPLASLAVSFYF